MKIIYYKKFDKHFEKLTFKLQNKVIETIELFQKNQFSPSLKNHPLKGSMVGKRAISVTGDMRIVFEEYDNYVLVVMLDVGTHNQIYY
jgi:addiction module RelE/StbE family toxin